MKLLIKKNLIGTASNISVTDGKIAAITAHIANLSNRNNTIEYWRPEYGT
ncbi:MAG: hypothetical protein ABFS16_16835 [Bacteroidota bacterium]